MKFITFKENNHKENETFIFFLQYYGNENELNRLNDIISKTDFSDLYGDYSTYEIDIKNGISEESVDELIKVNIGNFSSLFQKCKGKFKFPFHLFEELNETEMASKLDELLFACSIRDFFNDQFSEEMTLKFNYIQKIEKIKEDINELNDEDFNYENKRDSISERIRFTFDCVIEYSFSKTKKIKFINLLYQLLLTNVCFRFTNENLNLKIITIIKATEFKKDINNFLSNDSLSEELEEEYNNLIVTLDKYIEKCSVIKL
jgi:hypothetical protein